MSQENLEVARRALDAFNRRDLHAFLAAMDPDVDFTPFAGELVGSFHGHEDVRSLVGGTVPCLCRAALSLDTVHQEGLVHRDLKPANMLVESHRRGEHAYLTDFGLT
jgi:tRNA A-37 threonylcarbamoyl transferase component Bud32